MSFLALLTTLVAFLLALYMLCKRKHSSVCSFFSLFLLREKGLRNFLFDYFQLDHIPTIPARGIFSSRFLGSFETFFWGHEMILEGYQKVTDLLFLLMMLVGY